jgi:hypothetical protein
MAMLAIGTLMAYSFSAYISTTCRVLDSSTEHSAIKINEDRLFDTPASAIPPQDAHVNCTRMLAPPLKFRLVAQQQ